MLQAQFRFRNPGSGSVVAKLRKPEHCTVYSRTGLMGLKRVIYGRTVPGLPYEIEAHVNHQNKTATALVISTIGKDRPIAAPKPW